MQVSDIQIIQAAEAIKKSRYAVAFTGAGISVESGIPPFRGEGGLWNKYDPKILDIDYFYTHSGRSWTAIKEIFYDHFAQKIPNKGHAVLANWEADGILKSVITQNIDNLHQEAGSKQVIEFHGNSQRLLCIHCETVYLPIEIDLFDLPPRCRACGGLLKPDFVFFGETIPTLAFEQAAEAGINCDLMLIIGASGEVSPANKIPQKAADRGAFILEINRDQSLYTSKITSLFLQGKAGEILPAIQSQLQKINKS